MWILDCDELSVDSKWMYRYLSSSLFFLRRRDMKIELKRGLCLFYLGFLLVLFGTISRAACACNGSIAHCQGDEEFFMESEINRMLLAQHNGDIARRALFPDKPGSSTAKRGKAYTRPCT